MEAPKASPSPRDPVNPYAAPALAPRERPRRRPAIVPAGIGRRILTGLVDYACVLAMGLALGVSAVLVWGEEGLAAIEQVPDLVLGLPLYLGYYLVLEGTLGRTIGKVVAGTAVVDGKGGPASFGQVVGRTLTRMIPFEALSVFASQARMWHDSIPGTYVVVVRGRSAPVDAEG